MSNIEVRELLANEIDEALNEEHINAHFDKHMNCE